MTAKLPSLRALTKELSKLQSWGGGYSVTLGIFGGLCVVMQGGVRIPINGAPFDAVAAARRLLATARDSEER